MTTTPTADLTHLDLRNPAFRPEPPGEIIRWQRTVLAAAGRAVVLYPGPVGELIRRELHDALQFEFLATTNGQTRRLVEYLLAQPSPGNAVVDDPAAADPIADLRTSPSAAIHVVPSTASAR